MMRSLWTAASGMGAQQTNVDTISHNLANVNTTGFKKERLEFKSLLYQTIERADQDPANQNGKPVNLQIGLGVRPIATARVFDVGSLQSTSNPMDFAIEGKGFFAVQDKLDEVSYTRDGTFKVSVEEEGNMLVTSEGYPILGVDGEPIIIPPEVPISSVSISEEGNFKYVNADNETIDLGFQMGLYQFSNVQGLEAVGRNLLKQTAASGEALAETEGVNDPSRLVQGYIEMSNVQVADEMVNLIVAQRAYELNSKAITTSDEMLQQANNLKR